MTLANPLRKVASKLMAKFGGTATIRRVVAGAYNPTTGTVIASLTAQDWTGNTLSAIPFKASTELEGVFTSITLTSGTVVAYRL
jgi:hypothetical protein